MINDGFKCDVVDKIHSQTALFYAAREGHIQICELLIQNGCPVNHLDNKNKDAMFFAKKSNKPEVEKYLHQQKQIYKQNKQKQKQQQEELERQRKEQDRQERLIKQQQKQESKAPKKSIVPVQNVAKYPFKLMKTDEWGNQREFTNQDFQKFKASYGDVSNLIMNADKMIIQDQSEKLNEKSSWEKLAFRILEKMKKEPAYKYFEFPVDPIKTEFNIRDYHQIIKTPMDFTTIVKKLKGNFYPDCNEWLDDVKQIFFNCIIYNGMHNDFSGQAQRLYVRFFDLCRESDIERFLKDKN